MNHLRSVGGKASLPCELSKIIHPETKAKDNGFNLLSAFQGLSFSTVALTEEKHSRMSTNTRAGGDSCKVMWSICDHRDDLHNSFCLLVTTPHTQLNSRGNTVIRDYCLHTNCSHTLQNRRQLILLPGLHHCVLLIIAMLFFFNNIAAAIMCNLQFTVVDF